MEPKIAQFGNRGMQQDTSISKSSNEFAFENRNIRITAVNNDTLLSITNEKGPSQIPLKDAGGTDTTMSGTFMGHCVLGKYIVVFTSTLISERDKDKIYRLEDKGSYFECVTLFTGELGLIASHPVEAIGYYESEDIQKVYWVDGINQPRFINIIRPDGSVITDASTLNFVSTVRNFPKITVEKKYGGNGLFPAGVIQYFVTYYNKFGSETTIVGASDLNYITPQDRGGKADETVNCSFELTIKNVDSRFDYLRVYSAKRTSLDGPIEVQIVFDTYIKNVDLSNSITISDTNISQTIIDSNTLYYLGGEEFIAGTLEQKDNTLFLGDLTLTGNTSNISVTCDVNAYTVSYTELAEDGSSFYDNNFELNKTSSQIKYFKAGEDYRFAIQLQDNKGKWSKPYYVGDITIPISNDYRPKVENGQIKIPQIKLPKPTISGTDATNYTRYRVLMAETSINTRRTLAQGVINPTVFNYFERIENSPYSMSSWCTRPMSTGNSVHYTNISNPIEIQCNQTECNVMDIGETLDTKQLAVILNSDTSTNPDKRWLRVFEIKSTASLDQLQASDVHKVNSYDYTTNDWTTALSLANTKLRSWGYSIAIGPSGNSSAYKDKGGTYVDDPITSWASLDADHSGYDNYWCAYYLQLSSDGSNVSKYQEYFIDTSIVTLSSPDLETAQQIIDNNNNIKFRLVGISIPQNTLHNHTLEISPGVANYSKAVTRGTAVVNGAETLTSGTFYRDGTPMQDLTGDNTLLFDTAYASSYEIYLWHKAKEIVGINSQWTNIDECKGGELQHKIFGTERYCNSSMFFINAVGYDICAPRIFNSKEIIPLKLSVPTQERANGFVYYYGNYDRLLAPNIPYEIAFVPDRDFDQATSSEIPDQGNAYCTDPIRIKYKTTTEAVFSFGMYLNPNDNTYMKETIPYIAGTFAAGWGGRWIPLGTGLKMSSTYPWVSDFSFIRDELSYYDTGITFANAKTPYLFFGELYRDITNPYGTATQENLENTKWIPCSSAESLASVTAPSLEGDTYYQRWDNIKAYPFTEEDENSIVDITSFMVETHINIDGRCDINRGGTEITSYRPGLNFNLMNDVYSQENNVFEYNILDEKYDLSRFSNQITWSLTKTPMDDIDAWTHITMLSLLNLDGTYGAITKLSCINNALFAFQDRAISRINYNDRMQVSTEQNMPIEVQNSGKVQGYTYISKQIGCKNKWSICQSASGIYFTDTEKKSLYRINSEGLVDISASTGMSTWFKDNISNNPWKANWSEGNSAKISYDAITNDIYVSTDKDCIVYNEGLQSFTSFLPYKMTPLLFSLDGKSLMLDSICKLYRMFAGDYNTDKDGNELGYSIKYKINPEPLVNKTFTNLDLIADYTDDNKELVGITPFSHLSIWNEHQFGETNLEDLSQYLPEDQKNKFRVWRIQLPRDKKNSRYGLDRIQNPWVYIELNKTFNWEDKEKEEIEKEKNLMTFHSLLVKYFK